jgi:transposase
MEKISMPIIHQHAAGIDVGSKSHFVAIDQNLANVREFGVFTEDYQEMITFLSAAGVTSIAMESTGSYWQILFNCLQKAGFEVLLVNARHVKNLKGKKTDVIDCLWIQKLHSLGLLEGSFLLGNQLLILRTYYTHRQYLIDQTSKYINKMQKALRLMNIRLDVVLNDLTGRSGKAVLEAILSGERGAHQLASLIHSSVKKSREEILKSLSADWREDLLFELQSCYSIYKMYEAQILDCDKKLELELNHQNRPDKSVALKKIVKSRNKHSPKFDVRHLAFASLKTDLFEIPGVSHNTVLCFLSHMGNQIQKFPSAKHFAAWLRLTPNNKISGGKLISSRTPKGKNALAKALRQAANSIGNQKNHPLTPFFKRIAYKKDRIAAITATARKLAVIIWNMVTKTEGFKEHDYQKQSERMILLQLRRMKSRMLKMDLAQEDIQNYLFGTT